MSAGQIVATDCGSVGSRLRRLARFIRTAVAIAAQRARSLSPDPRVRLLEPPRRSPLTLAEHLALLTLLRRSQMPLSSLVTRVAEELYRDAVRHGGWAADIGVVSSALFLPDAMRAVEDADGVLWTMSPRATDHVTQPT